MKLYTVFSTLFLLIFAGGILSADYDKLPDRHVHILAADSLEGRYPGTEGGIKAANYIRDRFEEYGLELLCRNGFQEFSVLSSVSPKLDDTKLIFSGKSLSLFEDFKPYSYSGDVGIYHANGFAFAGYGFNFSEDTVTRNDYEGIDVEGEWVMILRGDPELDKSETVYARYTDDKKKVLEAKDQGASGVIFVSGVAMTDDDVLANSDTELFDAGIPVIQVTRKIANKMLEGAKKGSVEQLETKLNSGRTDTAFETDAKFTISIEMERNYIETQNVTAVKRSENSDEYIVIGAHYDHLGYGGPKTGSLMPDTSAIHNGADDNASGVAAMLEIARNSKDTDFDKNIIFIAFGAEEMGLHGSKFFVDNPPVDFEKIRLMLNFDMVGYLDEVTRKFSVSGVGTWQESRPHISKALKKLSLDADLKDDGVGPSDHAAFYFKGVPVLFMFTGTHDLYHKPGDDADYLNYAGLKDISDFALELVKIAAKDDTEITFKETAAPGGTNRRVSLKVTLGIVPDHTAKVEGLRVDGVRPGRPASIGGMEKGDIIVGINGKPIKNIYEYMHRLGKLKKGTRINVEVLREGKSKILIIDL